MKYGLIVHGGAWSIPDEIKEDHLTGVKYACELGYKFIKAGKNAVDVAEEVVKILEDNPTFDAGIGSHLNNLAEVEMDAIIATPPFRIGSVSAIQNVKNPISVARAVMEQTEHIMLVGQNSTKFAIDQGFPYINTEELLVGRERKTYEKLKIAIEKGEFVTKDPFNPKKQGFGTVGVVVRDKSGHLAIAVSTGGTPHKLAGRVGDTPLWGAGGYVSTQGGAAATGYGEDLIRVLISHRVVNYIESGLSPQKAAEKAISDLSQSVDGLGGVIVLSNDDFGIAFNTKRMAFAVQTDDHQLYSGIEFKDLDGLLSKVHK